MTDERTTHTFTVTGNDEDADGRLECSSPYDCKGWLECLEDHPNLPASRDAASGETYVSHGVPHWVEHGIYWAVDDPYCPAMRHYDGDWPEGVPQREGRYDVEIEWLDAGFPILIGAGTERRHIKSMSNFDESKVNRNHGKFAPKSTSEADVNIETPTAPQRFDYDNMSDASLDEITNGQETKISVVDVGDVTVGFDTDEDGNEIVSASTSRAITTDPDLDPEDVSGLIQQRFGASSVSARGEGGLRRDIHPIPARLFANR